MKLVLKSSGKAAVLSGKVDADLFIDCRGMVNPFRDPVLGGLHGSDPKLIEWMKDKNADYVQGACQMIDTALTTASTRNSFKSSPEKPLTVCFFCLAGQHRSPALKHVVAEFAKEDGIDVEVQ